LLNRSIILGNQGKYELALESITGALRATPDRGDLTLHRAFRLYQLARFTEALAEVDRAVAQVCCGPSGHADLLRGQILLELERHEEALSACEMALSGDSSEPDPPRYTIVEILCQGPEHLRDTARARELAEEIRNAHDRSEALGTVYVAGGHLDEARSVLEQSLADGNRDCVADLALVTARLGDLTAASEYLRQAVEYQASEPPVGKLRSSRVIREVEELLPHGSSAGQADQRQRRSQPDERPKSPECGVAIDERGPP
jgi:tetratricopeptide (TPR) repeat protein